MADEKNGSIPKMSTTWHIPTAQHTHLSHPEYHPLPTPPLQFYYPGGHNKCSTGLLINENSNRPVPVLGTVAPKVLLPLYTFGK